MTPSNPVFCLARAITSLETEIKNLDDVSDKGQEHQADVTVSGWTETLLVSTGFIPCSQLQSCGFKIHDAPERSGCGLLWKPSCGKQLSRWALRFGSRARRIRFVCGVGET